MSQHSSLRSASKGRKHRSVLKRRERVAGLEEKGEWNEARSVFGLPKVKILRIKVRKEKAAEEAKPEEIAAAPGGTPPAETSTTAKPQAKPTKK